MKGKHGHLFCIMVHVLRGIATGILFPLCMSNINIKSIRTHFPNIFHAPVLPPQMVLPPHLAFGSPGTWEEVHCTTLLLGTASLPMAQQDLGICGGKAQGETKVIGGKSATLSASPEK